MDKIIQIFKTRWLTILLSIGLISTSIVISKQKKEINDLNYEVSDLEDKVSSLSLGKKEYLPLKTFLKKDALNSFSPI